MKGRRFTAVVFDLDGTLVEIDDIKEHADEVLKRTLSEFEITRTSFDDRYKFFFSGIGFLALLEKWGIASEDQKRSFLETLSREEYAEKKMLIEQGSARLYKDATILDTLRGKVKLGLVTNSSAKATSLEIRHFKIEKYFDSIVSLGDFTSHLAPKPDPDGVIHCLKNMGVPPSKSIVVGDNLTDTIAGDKSGAHTALILRGRPRTSARNGAAAPRIDFRLRALTELEKIVR